MSQKGSRISRRKAVKGLCLGAVGGLAGCTGDGGSTPTPEVRRETVVQERTVIREQTPEELTELHVLETEGTETVPLWLYGVENRVWHDHGIDLSVEVAPFPKKSRAVVSDIARIGTNSLPQVPTFIEEGEDLTMFGTKQNLYNQIFVRADSDIESVQDLAGRQVAIPPLTSTTTNVVKAMIEGELGFNLLEDTENTRPSGPPTLLPLLEQGEVDAVLLFSGDTISATVSDEFRSIFDPYELWLDSTGFKPPVSNWSTRRSWIADNAELVLRFLAGWEDAVQLFKENITEAVTNYGRLGGVSTEAEADLIREWLNQDKVVGPFDFTPDMIDNQWQMMELIAERGTSDVTLPEKDDVFVSRADVESMAS